MILLDSRRRLPYFHSGRCHGRSSSSQDQLTAPPRQKRRSEANEWGKHDTNAAPSECGTYRDDKVETDCRNLDDTARSFGDRSLGGPVSVSSARETAYFNTPARSSFFGLLTAQPRPIIPEREVEVDLHSVYDCDDGAESVEAAIGTANLLASFQDSPL